MSSLASIYFNFIRLLCALIVFIYHAGAILGGGVASLSKALGLGDGRIAHLAVIIFFVLSGYLIYHAILKPEINWRRYAVERLARLSSVFLPGLLLTLLSMLVVWLISPEAYARLVPNGWQALRFGANFFYLHQIWGWCVVPGFNTPTWSLAYEFWYYAMLGVWFFITGRTRWLCLGLICLFVGYKIILLFPCWMAGAVARRLKDVNCINGIMLGLAFFFASLALVIYGLFWASESLFWNPQVGMKPFYYSANFAFDILFSGIVAVNFWTVVCFGKYLGFNIAGRLSRLLALLSGATFSLYIYHYPLLIVLSLLGVERRGDIVNWCAVIVSLLIVGGLAAITEFKLAWWRDRVALCFR